MENITQKIIDILYEDVKDKDKFTADVKVLNKLGFAEETSEALTHLITCFVAENDRLETWLEMAEKVIVENK